MGAWTLFGQACLIAGVTAATIQTFAPLVVLIGVAGSVLIQRAERTRTEGSSADDTTSRKSTFGVAQFWPPLAIVAVYAVIGSDWLFWTLAVIYLVAAMRAGKPQSDTSIEPLESRTDDFGFRYEVVVLVALCVLAVLLTAGSNRPDPDDGYFLNVAAAVGEFPEAVPQSFDAMHLTGLPPVEQTLHLPQVYEIGIGVASRILRIPASTLYYVVLPPAWAVLGTLATWVFLRAFLRRREALFATAVFVFVLAFWGDGGRTFGSFGFVRLFQGKAACLVFVIPFLTFSAFRFRQRPSAAGWILLASGQLAATGLTTNGVVIAPLATFLALASVGPYNARFIRIAAAGLTASIPMLLTAALMYPRLAQYPAALSLDDVLLGYATTLGSRRGWLVLLAVLMLPMLAQRTTIRHAFWITGYVRLVLIVVFFPATSVLASGLLGHVFSWRLFWSVPIPFLVSLAAGVVASGVDVKRWRPRVALAGWSIAFATAGSIAASPTVWSWHNIGRPKVQADAYAAAEAVVSTARPGALALAPEPVAIYVAGMRGAPSLVGVRELYLRKEQEYADRDELLQRLALLKYAERPNLPPEFRWDGFKSMSEDDALRAVADLGITTFAFPESHPDAARLVEELRHRGWGIQNAHGYVVAALPS
jgi:hypothetical protein